MGRQADLTVEAAWAVVHCQRARGSLLGGKAGKLCLSLTGEVTL